MILAMSAPKGHFDVARVETRDDEELEVLAARGDRDALERLLEKNAPSVLTLCRALCGPLAARDLAQEALSKVVSGILSFDPARGSFRTFALAVARNVCRDHGRRQKLERARTSDQAEAEASDPGAKNPEAEVLQREFMSELDRALLDLPEPMREALVRFHLHEASYEEIAKALEVPVGTVMSWLHRGRKRLQDALSKRGT